MRQKTLLSLTIASVLSLSIGVSACSKERVRTVSSHPSASSFVCDPEPAALTEEQIMSDQFGTLERQFTVDGLMAGRSCRDALQRVCQWHKDRGMKEPASCAILPAKPAPAPAPTPPSNKPERG